MLKSLLRILQSRRFPKQIKMCKYPKHIPRHPARTKHIQKLHCLHLKAEIAIDHQEYYISNLAHVDHAGEGVGGTFYERQTPPLGGDDCERTAGGGEIVLGITLDQGFDEGGFADAGGTDNGDNYGRGFFREAVDKGNVEAFFFDLGVLLDMLIV